MLSLDELDLGLEVRVLDVSLLTDFVAAVLGKVLAFQHLQVERKWRNLLVVALLLSYLYKLLADLVRVVVHHCF